MSYVIDSATLEIEILDRIEKFFGYTSGTLRLEDLFNDDTCAVMDGVRQIEGVRVTFSGGRYFFERVL